MRKPNPIPSTAMLGLALLIAACGGKSTPAETCDDGVKNQYESDVDCGGSTCSACRGGKSCAADSDCVTNTCTGGVCSGATCSDGILHCPRLNSPGRISS